MNTEELTTPEFVEADMETPDGFRKLVKEQIVKLSCTHGKTSDEDNSGASSRTSTSSQDFQESKTAFVATEAKEKDSDTYKFTHPKRGLAVIINNEDFFRMSDGKRADRQGSSVDRKALCNALKHLGFDVLVHNNLKAKQMLEVLRQAASGYDHTKADCFACAILTHGHQTWTEGKKERQGTSIRHDILYGIDWTALATKHVFKMFCDEHCPGLAGKPRLFFLQACRGSDYDDGLTIKVTRGGPPNIRSRGITDSGDGEGGASHTEQQRESLSSSVDPPRYDWEEENFVDAREELKAQREDRSDDVKVLTAGEGGGDVTDQDQPDSRSSNVSQFRVSPAPLYKDFLVMYATPPGFYAWRRDKGTWFIQELCKLLNSPQIHQKSLVNILIKVTGQVAREYESINSKRSMDKKKECPVIESMLVKDLIFTKK